MTTNEKSQEIRPRTFGELFVQTFRHYWRQFWYLMAVTGSIYLPYLLLQDWLGANVRGIANQLSSATSPAQAAHMVAMESGQLAAEVLLLLVSALVVTPLMYGMILRRVAGMAQAGVLIRFGTAFRHALRRLLPAMLTGFLRGVMLFVMLVLCGAILGAAAAFAAGAGASATAVAVIVSVCGLVLGIVMIWLCVKFAFAVPVALEERRLAFSAMGRSWVLTRRNFFRSLFIFILFTIIVTVVATGLGIAIQLLSSAVAAVALSNLIGLLGTPLTLTAAALLYVDLCVRSDRDDEFGGSGRYS